MNATEAGELVALMALYDNRKASDPDIVAWLKVIGDLQYGDCEAAVVAHYQETRERIMPADIRKRVKAMRRERIDRAIPAAPPAELADDPDRYRAELKRQIREIADARSMNRAIEGPAVKGKPPTGFTEARNEMGAAMERPGSLTPQEIARRQASESRAIRNQHDDPPAKDPAAREPARRRMESPGGTPVTDTSIRPPIPASCAYRPIVGGLVAPFVNLRLADGGVDFRSPHHATYEKCWRDGLCQTCGEPLTHPAVLFGGPNQLRDLHFDEPPLCAPCAVYASRACPMVAGRQERYADRDRIADGQRGHTCPDGHCDCGGWTPTDPSAPESRGDPAHPWYAVYVKPGAWQLTGKQIVTVCSDKGCEHERVIVNGAYLTASPLKVVLVSEPGRGRVWRTLSADEASALTGSAR